MSLVVAYCRYFRYIYSPLQIAGYSQKLYSSYNDRIGEIKLIEVNEVDLGVYRNAIYYKPINYSISTLVRTSYFNHRKLLACLRFSLLVCHIFIRLRLLKRALSISCLRTIYSLFMHWIHWLWLLRQTKFLSRFINQETMFSRIKMTCIHTLQETTPIQHTHATLV